MYSQGNWIVSKRLNEESLTESFDIVNSSNQDKWEWIASVHSQFNGVENGRANAKLIAAAPDLLKALNTLLSDEMYNDISYPTKVAVEAAINKATLKNQSHDLQITTA